MNSQMYYVPLVGSAAVTFKKKMKHPFCCVSFIFFNLFLLGNGFVSRVTFLVCTERCAAVIRVVYGYGESNLGKHIITNMSTPTQQELTN